MTRKLAASLAAILTVAVLFAATLPEEHRSLVNTRGSLHPYVHVAIFTLIAWLVAWTSRKPGIRVLLCVAVALLGCTTELAEWRMSQNPLEWTDIILDAMGAVAGTGLGALTLPRQFARQRYPSER